MLDSGQDVIQTAHLVKCSDTFVANMSFPRGEYTYLLDGVDTSGVSISYRFIKKVQFKPGEYELIANGEKTIEIELSDTFDFSFSISNLNSYMLHRLIFLPLLPDSLQHCGKRVYHFLQERL